ncbi:MAG: hypothetical protein HUU45_15130 [Leptospiraceae bacterium]|nr:hypothetical protein [Leptospiraceae bacterium]
MKYQKSIILVILIFLQCSYTFQYGSIKKVLLMQEGESFSPDMKLQEIVYCGKTSFEKSDNVNNSKTFLLDGLFDKVREIYPKQNFFKNIQIEVIPGNDFLLPCAYFRVFKNNQKDF